MFVTTVTTGRLQATPEIPTVGTATMRATTFSLMSPIHRGPRPRRDFETSSRTDCDEAADKVSVGPSLEVGLESSLWAMTSPRLALHNGLMQDLPSIKEVPDNLLPDMTRWRTEESLGCMTTWSQDRSSPGHLLSGSVRTAVSHLRGNVSTPVPGSKSRTRVQHVST